jgi:hypothetical protein
MVDYDLLELWKGTALGFVHVFSGRDFPSELRERFYDRLPLGPKGAPYSYRALKFRLEKLLEEAQNLRVHARGSRLKTIEVLILNLEDALINLEILRNL